MPYRLDDKHKSKSEDWKKGHRQGYNDKLDESLGSREGKESSKKQNLKARRDESKGVEKSKGKRAYSAVGTMDKGKK